MWNKQSEKAARKGFTLMETLGVVGIIAVLLGIMIPSIISIQRSLQFQKMNDYAKEIFIAAQSNLSQQRAAGGLSQLCANESGTLPNGAQYVPGSGNALFPAEDWSSEYCYTTGGRAFDLVLPAGTIEDTLRSKKILIEYNPVTGNVYSVFYSEGDTALDYDNVYRDEASRRELMLGYYAGSGLSSSAVERNATTPIVAADVNGQEAIVKISVPVPVAYINRPQAFLEGMAISATVKGEISGGSFEIPASQLETARRLVEGNTVEVQFCLDSLADQKSFASLPQNNAAGASTRRVSEIASADSFHILPGDNLTITAHFEFTNPENGAAELFDDVSVSGINSLFGSMEIVTADGETRYNIYLNNGRHLQNLNAMAAALADNVENVYFANDIYWNETVDYYTQKYGAGTTYRSNTAEAPARMLPYFVPISNKALFGEAHFSTTSLPTLSDVDDSTDYANVNGGNYGVYYLNIDATRYNIGKNYYAGSSNFGIDRFTGLFSYLDTSISNLRIVNPRVAGVNSSNVPATGSLVGACGHRAYIYGCSAYIDTKDPYFTRVAMSTYGVSGYGSVGGLVGYAKSHNTVSGDLVNNASYLAFSNCFTALPVSGQMRGNTDRMYGYSNGVGGVVGCSVLTNFYNCYSSGSVTASGCLAYNSDGRYSMGAGGFVGTSHGTKYTNCFATGNVAGTGSNQSAGGFLGVMCHDEGFNYTNTETHTTTRITQGTIFSSCYAAGTVTANGTFKENFNGYNAPIGVSGSSYPSYPNYYDYCARYGQIPTGEWRYLFKDSYYLNLYQHTEQTYSKSCAQVVTYDNLANLPAYQAQLGAASWRWREQYENGFNSSDWAPATAATTHSYALNAGSVYPFSKLSDLDYYGDWPTYPLTTGLAYYEIYTNNEKGFYFDRDTTSTLQNDQTIASDGYALLSMSLGNIQVTVNGVSAQLRQSGTITMGNAAYYVYYLPYSMMEAGSAQEFYTQVTAVVGGKQYTMYFNPRFAITQINPPVVEQQQQTTAEKPNELPTSISVRTARQFCALSLAPAFWGNGYHYQQELNLSTATYANTYTDGTPLTLTAQPVGNAQTPFEGSYSGENGYVVRPRLDGFVPSADSEGNAGLFGVIGESGTVRALTLQYSENWTFTMANGTVNAGLLAGRSAGTLKNITLIFNKDATMNVQQAFGRPSAAGLLAGKNTGTVTGCTLRVKGNAAITADSAGGLLGESSGASAAVSGCSVVLDGDFAAEKSQYCGAFAGSLTDGVFEGSQSAVVTVGGSVRGGGVAGGFAGLLGGTVSNVNVSLNDGVVSAGSAAGLAGEVRSARVLHSSVTLPADGEIRAQNGEAAGVFGTVNTLRATNVTAVLQGTVAASSGSASGFAASANNTLCSANLCRVTLGASGRVSAAAGKASGFYGVGAGIAENCSVYLTEGAQIAGKTGAAGFAVSQAGTFSACTVTGAGSILSDSGFSAGFAGKASGVITGCLVSPVRADTTGSVAAAYKACDNTKLTVRGVQASGFAASTDTHAVISDCAALGTVEGSEQAAGFVGVNTGTVAASTANTRLGSIGAGFAAQNKGIVRNSYAWYAPSGTAAVASGFAGTNTGSVTGAYAAPLNGDAVILFGPASGTYVNCYGASSAEDAGASGIAGVNQVTFEALACVDVFSLDASGSDWKAANTNPAYPFAAALGTVYPYPMLKTLPQYGDWVNAPTYAYGVAYYEKAADGTYTYKVVDLSDPEQTVEERSFSFDNISVTEEPANVAQAGYAVFYHNAAQLRSIQLGAAPLCADIASLAQLPAPADVAAQDGTVLDFTGYTFRIISSDAGQESAEYRVEADNASAADAQAQFITVTGLSGQPVTLAQYFARAINIVNEAYEVRTPVQLQNLAARPAASYTITHNISLAGLAARTLGTQEAPFKGTVLGSANGLQFVVSGYSRTQQQGDTSLFGVLQSAKLENVVLTDAAVSVAAAGADVQQPVYTVGVLTGSTDAQTVLKNCAVRGAQINVAVESGPDAQLALGALAARSAGAIENCSAQSVAVHYTPVSAPDGQTPEPVAAAVQADIGGLVGTLQGGTVTGSFAEGGLEYVPSQQGTHIVRNAAAVYRVGGAVGAEAATADVPKAYTDCYAAVAVSAAWGDAAADSAGKFIGYVYNGAFRACHGWDEETQLAFLGDIYSQEQTLTGPLYESAESYDAPKTVVKTDAGYDGFAPVDGAVYHTYLAQLNDCYYSAANGEQNYSIYQQRIAPQNNYYTLAEQQVNDNAYTAQRLKITTQYSAASRVQFKSLISRNYTTPQKTEYYYQPDGEERYYSLYITRSGRRDNYTYELYYYPTADGAPTRIGQYSGQSADNYITGVVLYAAVTSTPALEANTNYMVVAYNRGMPMALVNQNDAVGSYPLTDVYAADSFIFTDPALYASGAWTWTPYYGSYGNALANNGKYLALNGYSADLTAEQYDINALLYSSASLSDDEAAYGAGTVFTLSNYSRYYFIYNNGFSSSYYGADRFQLYTLQQTAAGTHTEGVFTRAAQDMECVSEPYQGESIADLAAVLDAARNVWAADARYPVLAANRGAAQTAGNRTLTVVQMLMLMTADGPQGELPDIAPAESGTSEEANSLSESSSAAASGSGEDAASSSDAGASGSGEGAGSSSGTAASGSGEGTQSGQNEALSSQTEAQS